MDFSSIYGHTEIKKVLKNVLINDRIAHAYIFTGQEGMGKTTVAQIMSSILLCKDRAGEESCGICTACRLFLNLANPDFKIISSEGSSISVDDIRENFGDVYIKPMYSSKKVYIIKQAEKMTPQAQNSLLKTLEEPPEYVTIFLIANKFEALLETIRSRSIRLNFPKLSSKCVEDYVRNNLNLTQDQLLFTIGYSDGNIGKAIEITNSEHFSSLRDDCLKIIYSIISGNREVWLDKQAFFNENKDDIQMLLDVLVIFYRDILLVKTTEKENMLINSDKKDIIINSAEKLTLNQILDSINIIEDVVIKLKQNVNFQLCIEVMLMKLQEV